MNLDILINTVKNGGPNLEELPIAMHIFFRVAQLLQHKRVRLESKLLQRNPFVNFYGMLFQPSGTGKSYMIEETYQLFINPYYKHMHSDYLEGYKKWVQETMGENPDAKEIDLKKGSRFELEIGRGTLQGVLKNRINLQRAQVGGGNFVNDEFTDFIKSESQGNKDFLTALKEAYNGSTKSNVLGVSESYQAVTDVPQSMLVSSSPYNLFGDGDTEKVWGFFNRGFARRCFICYVEEKPTPVEGTVESRFEALYSEANSRGDYLSEAEHIVDKIWDCLSMERYLYPIMSFQKDADFELFQYKETTQRESYFIREEHIKAELKDRFFKAAKLAGIIAMIEHPDDMKVYQSDVIGAITFTEAYGKHFTEFFKSQTQPAFLQILDVLRKNPDKTFTRSEIYNLETNGNRKTKQWLDSVIEQITDYLSGTNGSLVVRKLSKGRNGVSYQYHENGEA